MALMATEDSDRHVLLPVTERRERVLSTDRLRALGDISAAVDRHLGCPHEIEWCTVGDSFYILQARPIRGPASPDVDDAKVLLVGTGVGRGVATGTVRIAIDIDAASHTIAGDILVAPETAPEWLPFIGRASAVVADLGDEHGHTATACRELGIPAIVGTATATTMLDEFRCVTVDADHGHVLPAASD
ncbi:MAG: pyruvate,water dikinase [Myxococcota bacterium]